MTRTLTPANRWTNPELLTEHSAIYSRLGTMVYRDYCLILSRRIAEKHSRKKQGAW
jgi:hypothetical protein